ncbi:two-component sensor histidine kinase, partial [Nostoc sp. NIES-2111]
RILFGYALILCFIFVVFVPAFREVLYARINGRVHRQVNEKMQIFKQLISGKTQFSDDIELDQDNETIDRLIENDNRFIKAPKTKEELRKFLDAFLGNQLPEDDTFLIMLWQGKFYKSSPRARPKEL